MNKQRLIPLIVATALFMENMDSTVIATSLPAIAADIGTSPLTLKLAITSYLLSLAVFIPASGWTADRFGARMVFSIAIAVFMVGSIGCALSQNVTHFVIARILQGMGGAMMTPVGRLVLLRSIDKSALVNAMTWVTVPALIGPVIGPPLGGFITTYFSWHWIFLINIPIGLLGIFMALKYIDPIKSEDPERFDLYGLVLAGIGLAGIAFGLSVAGLNLLPWPIVAGLVAVGSISMTLYVMHARRTGSPVLDFSLLRLSDDARQHHRRLPVPARHRRAAVPAAAVDAGRLRPVAVPVGPRDLRLRGRRHGHEDAGRAHHPHLRLPQHDDGQRRHQRGLPRRLRAVHGDDAAVADLHHPGRRRLLPLAAVHRDQHRRLRRGRAGADEPRHHAGQRQPATGDFRRRRRRRVLGGIDHGACTTSPN